MTAAAASTMATTATAGKVAPMTAAMIAMSAAMATAIATAGIERIGGDIGYDAMVENARWRSLIQIEFIKIIGAVEIPGERFVAHDEFNDFAAGNVYVGCIRSDNDGARSGGYYRRITHEIDSGR